jgi:imidazolonepropionase-like amidohydrolase
VVRSGAAADLLLLEANPLDDVANASRIGAMILRGQLM